MKVHNITVYEHRVGLVCDSMPDIAIGDFVKITDGNTGHYKTLYVDTGDYSKPCNDACDCSCDCSCALYDKDTGCCIKCTVSLIDGRSGHTVGEGYTSFCSGTTSVVKLRYIDELLEDLSL